MLRCDAAAVAAAGAKLGSPDRGEAQAALASAIRADGGLAGAAAALRAFVVAPRPRPVPRFLPALGLLVLVAHAMGERDGIGGQVYYRRLAPLLGRPDRFGSPPYRGLAQCCKAGFPALAEWLAQDEGGTRGTLLLPHDPLPPLVGWPISQAPLRAGDRRRLRVFHADRTEQLRVGWDPAALLLDHAASRWLSRPARELLADPRGRIVMSDALRALVDDGQFAPIPRRRRRRSSSRGLLHGRLDPHRGRLDLVLAVEGVERERSAVGPDGRAVLVPPPPGTLAVPLAWCEHAAHAPVQLSFDDGSTVEALPARTVLFAESPLGLRQIDAPGRQPLWALTCRSELEGEPVRCQLPDGWRLLAAVDPASVASPPREPRVRLRFTGGLPLGERTWMAVAPPAVVGPAGYVGEVLVDGVVVGRIEDDEPVALDVLAGCEGAFTVEVGKAVRTILLAGGGVRQGYGSICWRLDEPARAAAGAGPWSEVPARPLLAGAQLVGADHADAAPSPAGPWTRMQGTVHALLASGAASVVGSPPGERWYADVGYGTGGRWRLPAGTVWACQPGRRLVELADPDVPFALSDRPEVLALVARCGEAAVLGPRGAAARWRLLVREAQGRSDG